jgi:hypothetical protein
MHSTTSNARNSHMASVRSSRQDNVASLWLMTNWQFDGPFQNLIYGAWGIHPMEQHRQRH